MDENKKSLSEEDIKNRYITPALDNAGWEKTHYRMEYYFTAGRVLIQGKQHARKEGKKADYLLFASPNIQSLLLKLRTTISLLEADFSRRLSMHRFLIFRLHTVPMVTLL